MRRLLAVLATLLTCLPCYAGGADTVPVYLIPPVDGVYHAAHPDFGLRDDDVTPERVRAFKALAGKGIVWSFVSFHWEGGIVFPTEACLILRGEGVIPLVGVMPWSTLLQCAAEPVYTLEKILSGAFDDQLRACAREVKSLGFPIMMEFGPEANGSWFPWSGVWNGGDGDGYGEKDHPDGPERFRDSYRRVVKLFREEGALNVTWVFHAASSSAPDAPWNAAKFYYPGDEWVDWIGVSLYGRLRGDEPVKPFDVVMRRVYPELSALSQAKPIALLEIGVSDDTEGIEKARWIKEALRSICARRYPRVRAVSWWNKIYRQDGARTNLEVNSTPQGLAAYREGIRELVETPYWSPRGQQNH